MDFIIYRIKKQVKHKILPDLFYIPIGLAENVRIEQSVFCGNRNVCLLAQS